MYSPAALSAICMVRHGVVKAPLRTTAGPLGDGASMARYIVGAMLMGFGSMLAGGCAVGAGMTGGAIFALTAWITLAAMFVGGGLMDRWLAEPVLTAQPATQQAPVVLQVAP